MTRELLARELFLQQFIDLRRIGLALGRLHGLADQRVERLVLAGAVLRDVVSVGGNDAVDYGLQLAGCLLYTSRCV